MPRPSFHAFAADQIHLSTYSYRADAVHPLHFKKKQPPEDNSRLEINMIDP